MLTESLKKAKADYLSIFPSNSKKGSPTKFIEVDGIKTDNKQKAATCFSQYYSAAGRKVKENAIKLVDFCWRMADVIKAPCNSRFKFQYVSKVEVKKHLRKLKRKKSSVPDDLPPGMLKVAAGVISSPLSKIINLALKTRTFPTEWKIASIVPVF